MSSGAEKMSGANRKTYVWIGLGTVLSVVAVVAVLTTLLDRGQRSRPPQNITVDAQLVPTLQLSPVVPRPPARPWEDEVMHWAGRALPAGRGTDITSGRPHRVDLFQDAGERWVNRASVDLDRDGKWDETWVFTEADVIRSIAPADDEVYTRTLTWNGGGWDERPDGAPATP